MREVYRIEKSRVDLRITWRSIGHLHLERVRAQFSETLLWRSRPSSLDSTHVLYPRLFYVSSPLSLSVRTTHVRAIRYDWLDPRFRTNHFIKASVLNKPAFDYSPCHLVVIVPYTISFLRTFRSNRFTSPPKNYLVVYPAATDHRPIVSRRNKPVAPHHNNFFGSCDLPNRQLRITS